MIKGVGNWCCCSRSLYVRCKPLRLDDSLDYGTYSFCFIFICLLFTHIRDLVLLLYCSRSGWNRTVLLENFTTRCSAKVASCDFFLNLNCIWYLTYNSTSIIVVFSVKKWTFLSFLSFIREKMRWYIIASEKSLSKKVFTEGFRNNFIRKNMMITMSN